MDKKEEISCKTILVGETAVGKTSIIDRFSKDIFRQILTSTTSGTFDSATLETENYSLEFQLWDTAGQERYRGLTKMFLKDADIVLLVYDITNKETFEELKNYWYGVVKENNSENISKSFKFKKLFFLLKLLELLGINVINLKKSK